MTDLNTAFNSIFRLQSVNTKQVYESALLSDLEYSLELRLQTKIVLAQNNTLE